MPQMNGPGLPKPRAGTLLLGWGSYTLDPDAARADPLLAQMENRVAIAEFMEEQGHRARALQYLLENVSCAEKQGERGLLVNALQDVQQRWMGGFRLCPTSN